MNKEDIIDLIRDAGFGFLATVEEKQPRVRAVAPYLTEENTLLIALFSNRRTLKQVKENPLVEICFIDRKMSYCRISGKATITTDQDKKQSMWDNTPMLRQYFDSPKDMNMNLVEITINNVEAMSTSDQKPQNIDF